TGSPWDAEDLVQDTLVRAFGRLAQNWQPTNPRSYLFRIATNGWLDSRKAAPTLPIEDSVEAGEAHADAPIEETLAALDYLSTTLTPRQAVVVLLADVFDFRVEEVAAMIAVSRPAAKALLQRARATLREARDCEHRRLSARRLLAP